MLVYSGAVAPAPCVMACQEIARFWHAGAIRVETDAAGPYAEERENDDAKQTQAEV